MYCVKCGVELADSESKCPLCHTPISYPGYVAKEEEKPYPRFEKAVGGQRGDLQLASFRLRQLRDQHPRNYVGRSL